MARVHRSPNVLATSAIADEGLIDLCPSQSVVVEAISQMIFFARRRFWTRSVSDRLARDVVPATQQAEAQKERGIMAGCKRVIVSADRAQWLDSEQGGRSNSTASEQDPGRRVGGDFPRIFFREDLAGAARFVDPICRRRDGSQIRLKGFVGPRQEITGPEVVGIEERDELDEGCGRESGVARMSGSAIGLGNDTHLEMGRPFGLPALDGIADCGCGSIIDDQHDRGRERLLRDALKGFDDLSSSIEYGDDDSDGCRQFAGSPDGLSGNRQ